MKSFTHTVFHSGNPAVFAAPLAGVTDRAFQRILHQCGAPVISTEMIPSAALARYPKGVGKLVRYQSTIHPMNVQIFGYSAEHFVKTIDLIRHLEPDNIDINMGCPAKKVFNNDSGLSLMNDLPRATEIVRAVRRHFSGSVSIKIRLGVTQGKFVAPDFAAMAETEGADFVTVHGRYRTSMSVPADWKAIGEVKSRVTIPVIGNGDVFTPGHARQFLNLSGCDGVMVARGMLGNPWLPARINRYLKTGVMPPDPSVQERFRVFAAHLDYLIEDFGEHKGPLIFRKHAAWYLKGFAHITCFRKRLFTMSTPSEFYRLVMELYLSQPNVIQQQVIRRLKSA
jgi:tRNA-dihydrouridine synthase B